MLESVSSETLEDGDVYVFVCIYLIAHVCMRGMKHQNNVIRGLHLFYADLPRASSAHHVTTSHVFVMMAMASTVGI